MPTYVYECTTCSEQTELVQRVADAPLEKCPKCGGKVRKLLFPVGIVFKGSGFHINDYRKPEKKSSDSEPASSTSKPEPSKPEAATASS